MKFIKQVFGDNHFVKIRYIVFISVPHKSRFVELIILQIGAAFNQQVRPQLLLFSLSLLVSGACASTQRKHSAKPHSRNPPNVFRIIFILSRLPHHAGKKDCRLVGNQRVRLHLQHDAPAGLHRRGQGLIATHRTLKRSGSEDPERFCI